MFFLIGINLLFDRYPRSKALRIVYKRTAEAENQLQADLGYLIEEMPSCFPPSSFPTSTDPRHTTNWPQKLGEM